MATIISGMKPRDLPPELSREFHVSDAGKLGVTKQRLRASDLELPFRGVRMRVVDEPAGGSEATANQTLDFELARARELALIRALATSLRSSQFFTHRTAALLWGAPLSHRHRPELHVGVFEPQRAPRISNVNGHRFARGRVELRQLGGLLLASPAHTFAMLGELPLAELVAVGDYFARMHRKGYGRPNVGKPPHAALTELREAVHLGHWRGMPRLRTALKLVREDSWSPRESTTRVTLVMAGLPEPELNIDVYDRNGFFIGCSDIAYPRYKVGVEYHGQQHAERYAQDIERLERFRADGWEILQVTKALERRPETLVARVTSALRKRGWNEVLTPP